MLMKMFKSLLCISLVKVPWKRVVAIHSVWEAGDWPRRLPVLTLGRVVNSTVCLIAKCRMSWNYMIPPSPVSRIMFVGKPETPFSMVEQDPAVQGNSIGMPLFSPPQPTPGCSYQKPPLPAKACIHQSFYSHLACSRTKLSFDIGS